MTDRERQTEAERDCYGGLGGGGRVLDHFTILLLFFLAVLRTRDRETQKGMLNEITVFRNACNMSLWGVAMGSKFVIRQ